MLNPVTYVTVTISYSTELAKTDTHRQDAPNEPDKTLLVGLDRT